MIKKRFLLPAAAGALALAIGLAGIWFNQRLPALADFGVPGMDSEAQLMAWAALFPEKGVAALTFRTVLQWMAIAVFCTLGAVVLALYRYKPQKELGYFLLYLTVLTLWALVIILAPVGSSGWSVFFRRGFFTVTVLAGILLCAALTGAVPVSHGQRLHSLLLTLGYLVLTLVPLSRVRAVGLLLGMGYCLGILMVMYARGSDAALLMLFPCAITIGFRVWVVLPGMHVPFFSTLSMAMVVLSRKKLKASLLQKNSSVILGLYALADMGIHYDGWSVTDTVRFFSDYGINDPNAIECLQIDHWKSCQLSEILYWIPEIL